MSTTQETADRLKQVGESAYACIVEMVDDLNRAQDMDSCCFDWNEEAERLGLALEETKDSDGDAVEVWARKGKAYGDDAEEACRAAFRDDTGRDYPDEEEARRTIEEDALSVEVRSGWTSLGEPLAPEEFNILLSTGGPAVRIVGDLDEHGEPSRARLQTQDWFTPWTEFFGTESETLLRYCRVFYFGEV
jgi:hypothetical protein